ncbi:hypothetical protein VTL71DRAFT_3837 [Oculimacula yallundae]|uniref:Rhodopsin domain-containing protein n=1 Tax=Oculimacula yallundae TaxID=86028 RepID=A0ABR4C603_9HELO
MQLPPASVILSWPVANFTNPVTTGPTNVIITCLFFPIVCLVIAIRCYARVRISRSFGWEDWLILGAMIPTTAFMICALVAEWEFKWNRHIWDVRPDTLVVGLKMVLVTQVLFGLATTLTKLSMLVLVYRIAAEGSKTFSKVIIGVMVLITLECVAFVFLVIFQCGNPSTYWTLSFQPQAQCVSETKNLLAAGINNTIGDLAVVILPIPIIWRLKLPFQQQVIIFLLFGAGLLVTVASVLRTYYLYEVTSKWDKTWLAGPAWISSSVELYVGILCASLPATKKFFSRISPRLFGASNSSQHVSTTHRTYASDRHSYAGPYNLELGAYAEHVFPDGKHESFVDAFPSPPLYSHAVSTPSNLISRPQTAKTAGSITWDGMDDVTRVDSDDELVVGNHLSPPIG